LLLRIPFILNAVRAEQKFMKYLTTIFLLMISASVLSAPKHRPHHHPHRAHSINYNHLRDEKFQAGIYLDVLQQQASGSEAYNKNRFYNVVTESVSLNQDLGLTEEVGWSNDKFSASFELDANTTLLFGGISTIAGIKPQYTFQNEKQFSYYVYAFPKMDLQNKWMEMEEGAGSLYQLPHGFIIAADVSVIHMNLASFLPVFSGGIIKIF
jgi:hypothetical protein